MAADEEIRDRLPHKLRELLGGQEAAALMGPFSWDQVATEADLAGPRGEMLARFGALHKEIGGLRAELHKEISTAIRGQTFTLLMAMVGMVVAAAGLVLALS